MNTLLRTISQPNQRVPHEVIEVLSSIAKIMQKRFNIIEKCSTSKSAYAIWMKTRPCIEEVKSILRKLLRIIKRVKEPEKYVDEICRVLDRTITILGYINLEDAIDLLNEVLVVTKELLGESSHTRLIEKVYDGFNNILSNFVKVCNLTVRGGVLRVPDNIVDVCGLPKEENKITVDGIVKLHILTFKFRDDSKLLLIPDKPILLYDWMYLKSTKDETKKLIDELVESYIRSMT